MINTLKHAALLVTAIFMVATPAHSQAPTDAQRNAIRSACRADYQAHCASVPPGGEASLQCLQKNMSSLSSGCQSAVRALEPAAAPKAETAPSAAPKADLLRLPRPLRQLRSPPTHGAGGPESSGKHDRQQADRCTGCRDPQCLPLRLSEGLRRCARPEALRHCNAWKKTRRRFRRPARKPSTPPAVQHLQPAVRRLPPVARLRRPAAAPAVMVCGQCGGAKNCSS